MSFNRTFLRCASGGLAFCLMFSSFAYAAGSEEGVSQRITAPVIAYNSSEEINAIDSTTGEIVSDASFVIKKDRAIAIGRKLIGESDGYVLNSMTLNPVSDTYPSNWRLEFNKQKNSNSMIYIGMNIDVNTGEVVGYDCRDDSGMQPTGIAKFTRDEAAAIASKFIRDAYGKNPDDYELQPDYGGTYSARVDGIHGEMVYSLTYYRKVNGITYYSEIVNVGVDGVSGKVRDFFASKPQKTVNMPSPAKAMSKEAFIEAYKKYCDVELQYVSLSPTAMNSKPVLKLAYFRQSLAYLIDASTGKPVPGSGTAQGEGDSAYIIPVSTIKPLVEGAKLEGAPVTIPQARAEALRAKGVFEDELGVKLEENHVDPVMSGYNYSSDGRLYSFSWSKNTEKMNAGTDMTINPDTGYIQNLNAYFWDAANNAQGTEEQRVINEKCTWNEGRDKAIAYLGKMLPKQYGFFDLSTDTQPVYDEQYKKYGIDHTYFFYRIINGIVFRDNTISIAVNRETGKISSTFMTWTDVDVPQPKNVIKKDDAFKIMLDNCEAKLGYYAPSALGLYGLTVPDQQKSMGTAANSEDAILAYTLELKNASMGASLIDAETGKILDWTGNDMSAVTAPQQGAINSWAKRSIELLISQGIIREMPASWDEEISKQDAVRMLASVNGTGWYVQKLKSSFSDTGLDNPYSIYAEIALDSGIIDNASGKFEGTRKLTKNEYVKMLVRLIGYEGIAKHGEVFRNDGLTNVPDDMIGYVGVAKALGILPVKDGGTYDGTSAVTHAEASQSLYKALSYVRQ